MIEEVKAIKLKELETIEDELSKKKSHKEEKLFVLKDKLADLQLRDSNGLTIPRRFSFLDKLVFRRKEYKAYKIEQKELRELPTNIKQTEEQIRNEKERLSHDPEYAKTSERLNQTHLEMTKITNAKTLFNLGVKPGEAMQMLLENGIEPVLTEEDKVEAYHEAHYTSKSDLIGVHKTRYIPTDMTIRTAKNSNVKIKHKFMIDDVEYEYESKSKRDTIHMAANDEVSSHMFGNWDDCKYAILIPFEDIPNEQFGRAAPMDTFTRGDIKLTKNCWIICPQDEVKKIRVLNPDANVVGYKGDNVKGFSKPFLTQLGYRGEDCDMWSWQDNTSSRDFDRIMENEGIRIGTHTYTYFYEDEEILGRIDNAVELCKTLKNNGIIKSNEDVTNVMKQLEEQNKGFSNILEMMCLSSAYEHSKDEYAIFANRKHGDIFIEEMKKNGFEISPAYQGVIRNISKYTFTGINEENKNEVFEIPKDVSIEEKDIISQLRDKILSNSLTYYQKKYAFGKFMEIVAADAIIHSRDKTKTMEEEIIK